MPTRKAVPEEGGNEGIQAGSVHADVIAVGRGARANLTRDSADTPREIPSSCHILFLAANPAGQTQLALDEECREIHEKIRASEFRDALSVSTRWAVRPDDLLQSLNELRPHIVHFSGHGSTSHELLLQDADRRPRPVSLPALRRLFATMRDNIRVVMLNACYSRAQAEAITSVIDCAIGMNVAIGDQAAIRFAASFYRALGFGRSVQDAFDQGVTSLMLEGIAEEHTPELMVREGVRAEEVFVVQRE